MLTSTFLDWDWKGKGGRAHCCNLLSHSGEKDFEGVRYFFSRSSLRDSRSGFMRFRGRGCSERIESIQSSGVSVELSCSFSRELAREAILLMLECTLRLCL
jgi:hypothetical protein